MICIPNDYRIILEKELDGKQISRAVETSEFQLNMNDRPLRNIIFVMIDQLRWDYLSCYGHPSLKTPNIDWLAQNGVRFDRCYVQSPICGPGRMSAYTGRYLLSHGSTSNDTPLRLGERTLGEYLRQAGMKTVLVGKTHMAADIEGMSRLGIDPLSDIGRRLVHCGFDVFERDEGVHPDGPRNASLAYNNYLRSRGYEGANPWHTWANSVVSPADGKVHSGWLMGYGDLPARVAEPDSETPYIIGRGIDCIDRLGPDPWCLHLSLIKPHWPYIAPAPYHAMFGAEDILPAIRSEAERNSTHPFYRELRERRISRAFGPEHQRQLVIRAYMGLVKQLDDQIGRLLDHLRQKDLLDKIMIVFTSDHGDYLGDHWLGEKDFYHDASVKVPLLIYDPSPESSASRGTVCNELVEMIDLLPTFVDYAGGAAPSNVVEGRSLLPLLRGQKPPDWREFVFSEYDYTQLEAQENLAIPTEDARTFMIADERWKYILVERCDPFLFDMANDPNELVDLGTDPGYEIVRRRMREGLFWWSRRLRQRTTETHERLIGRSRTQVQRGVYVGFWDEAELETERRRLGLI